MKLDLILENVRNKYALGLLEESADMTEKDVLKGKILINESTMKIRKMLIEEGVMGNVQQLLQEAWGRKLAGATALGGAAVGGKMAYDAGKQFVDKTNAGIGANQLASSNNAGQINTNTAGIQYNNNGLMDHKGAIENNAGNIATNAQTGAANAGNIATNTQTGATNAGDIVTNAQTGATNAGDIVTNAQTGAANADILSDSGTTALANSANAIKAGGSDLVNQLSIGGGGITDTIRDSILNAARNS